MNTIYAPADGLLALARELAAVSTLADLTSTLEGPLPSLLQRRPARPRPG